MKTLLFFPNQKKINENASLWLTRMSRGLRAEEKSEFELWLSENKLHGRALWEIAVLWDEMEALSVLSKLYPVDEWKTEISKPLQPRFSLAYVALFIVTFSVLGVLGYYYVPGLNHDDIVSPIASTHYQTTIGERKSFSMPDGSIITLNTNSMVDIDFSTSARKVILTKGEAYFNVAKDKNRPFQVVVGERLVTAVGTAFNIRLGSEGRIEVIVSEGVISLSHENTSAVTASSGTALEQQVSLESQLAPISVSSGKRVILKGKKQKIDEVDTRKIMNDLAWQRGIIIVEGERLGDVINEINRYTSRKIITSDNEIKSILIGGFYKTDDIEGFLKSLKNNFQIESALNDDENIVLFRG